MSLFNVDFIKQHVPLVIFHRGWKIYKSNSVTLINLETTKIDVKKAILKGYFSVLSSQNDIRYEVMVDFYFTETNTQLRISSCECMYFQTHNVACKHVIAALFYCYDQSKGELLAWSGLTNSTESLIALFKGQQQYLIDNEQIDNEQPNVVGHIILELFNLNQAKLKLQVGIKKLINVKDIYGFIDLVTNLNPNLYQQKRFLTTYKFALEQKVHFPLHLQKTINFLSEELETVKASLPSYFTSFSQFDKSSEVNLLPGQTERFLKALQGERIDLVIAGVVYRDILITNEQYEVAFMISLVDNKIVIKNEKENPLFLTSKLQSIFINGKIMFFKEEQKNGSGYILQAMIAQNKNEITFDEKAKQDVLQYVLPSLTKQKNNNITLASAITTSIINTDLSIESYFDFDGTAVILKPVFKYGDITFNIQNKTNETTKMVIRSYDLEKSYLLFVKKVPFKKHDDCLRLNDVEGIITLLSDILPVLEQQSTIYYTDDFKKVRLLNFKKSTVNAHLNQENNLLEVNFEFDDINARELKEVLKSIKQAKKYHRLPDGRIVNLQNEVLTNFINLIDKIDIPLDDIEKGKIALPKYHAVFLEQQLATFNNIDFCRNQYFTDLITKINHFVSTDITIVTSLTDIMRDYQVKGHQWLKTLASLGFGGILADEMGLGKTLQAISYIAKEYELNPTMKPVVIIAPASIIYNWKSEFSRFAPNLKTIVVAGNKQWRKALLERYQDYQILITSYPLLRRDFAEYDKLSFSHCFIDEAQHIKNPISLNAKVTKDIKAPIRFALTGTPIENNLSELWSIFDFVLPGFLLSHHKFERQYELPIVRDKNNVLLKELTKKTQPFILRRLKKDVALELPDKIENKVIIEMTTRQKKIYIACVEAAKKELSEIISEKGFSKSKIHILSTLTRLRQICCDPSILSESYKNESAKIDTLRDMLEELINLGHKILIFSQFTKVLHKIEPILKELKINYSYLDGKTRTENRLTMIEEFNNNSEISVFLISLKAGGVGLNLTAADVVIHFDPWWNPSIENQATDRAHRIGQKKVVQVIKLITKGTIEEKIINIQDQKQNMINSVLDVSDDSQLITKLTEAELRNLLDLG